MIRTVRSARKNRKILLLLMRLSVNGTSRSKHWCPNFSGSLCVRLCVLCASVVDSLGKTSATETQRSQTHKESSQIRHRPAKLMVCFYNSDLPFAACCLDFALQCYSQFAYFPPGPSARSNAVLRPALVFDVPANSAGRATLPSFPA